MTQPQHRTAPSTPVLLAPLPLLRLTAEVTGVYGKHLAFDREGKRWALADHRTIQLGQLPPPGASSHSAPPPASELLGRKITSPGTIHSLAWSADGKQLLACPQRYDLAQYEWRTLPGLHTELAAGLAHPPPPEQLGLAAGLHAPDGQELLALARFRPLAEPSNESAYRGPRERLLLIDRKLRGVLLEGAAGELDLGGEALSALAFGERLIAAGGTTVTVWSRKTLQRVAELPHAQPPRALAFNAEGDRLAVLCAGGELTLWDPTAGTRLVTLQAHLMDGYAVAFHPSRPMLATGGQDGKLRVWSLGGAPLYEEFLGGWVHTVAFDPTGARLAAGTRAMPPRLRFYDLAPTE
jgi:WD domain, G-beta repeat